jgi:hypothetical protein
MPKRLTPFLAILSIVTFGTIIAHTFWEKIDLIPLVEKSPSSSLEVSPKSTNLENKIPPTQMVPQPRHNFLGVWHSR